MALANKFAWEMAGEVRGMSWKVRYGRPTGGMVRAVRAVVPELRGEA